MGAQEHRRADHASYIAAVSHSLEAHDIQVADVSVSTSPDGRREAALLLRPDEAAFAERVPGQAQASWDEDNGWSLLVWHESVASDVRKGLGVVPDPEDVAAWAVVVLAHPELTPSREDGPVRDHSIADPDFEARLAAYAPAG
jgi:Family of unknown function (DUF6292)